MINVDDLSLRFATVVFLMGIFVLLGAIFFGKFPTRTSSRSSRAASR